MDSVFSHANFGASLGGISYPLLGDFHPKGAVAQSFGLYAEDKGIAKRSTVVIDAGGVIRHISLVEPGGRRNMAELAELCEGIAKDYSGAVSGLEAPSGVPGGLSLFVKNQCGFSRSALLARDNLHLQEQVSVDNVDDDPAARTRLKELTGGEQAPALVVEGKAMLESADIVSYLVTHATGI